MTYTSIIFGYVETCPGLDYLRAEAAPPVIHDVLRGGFLRAFRPLRVRGLFCCTALASELAPPRNKKALPTTLGRLVVPRTGFEPAHLAALLPENSASTSFATWASGVQIYANLPSGQFFLNTTAAEEKRGGYPPDRPPGPVRPVRLRPGADAPEASILRGRDRASWLFPHQQHPSNDQSRPHHLRPENLLPEEPMRK